MPIARLSRTVIRLSGENVTDWLAGLITNNLSAEINFGALLTPQGKIIADFLITRDGGDWLLDTPDKFAADLIKRLKMYKLRAPITIEQTDLSVLALWDGDGEEGHPDPRDERLGRRLITEDLDTEHDADDYDAHRLTLGIPESQWDFGTAQMFPMDANMDLLRGVDYKKGCFVGQEVVSRMYRKSAAKKRMRGFTFDGNITEAPITADGRLVGEILHTNEGGGMALMRLNRLERYDGPLLAGNVEINLMDTEK